MSSERPSILSVKNDVIQVNLPYFEGTPETYLTAAVSSGGSSLTVKDNARLSQNDYVILGAIGAQQSEIKRITGAVSAGTALTIATTTFSHPINTKVTLSHYDQVEIYGSSSASDAAPTLIGSAVSLDVRRAYTEIKAGTTYSYYYARFKDSNAGTYSSYSDSAAASGLSARSRGEFKKEFLSVYNNKIDDLVTDDWLNRTINRWQRELQKRSKRWSCLRAVNQTNTVQDQQGYTLPSDIQDANTSDAIVSVKYYNQPELRYLDQTSFLELTSDHIYTTVATAVGLADVTIVLTDSSDFPSSGSIQIEGDTISFTGNTKSTNTLTGVTGISATHAAGTEVWGSHTTGIPTNFTINNGKIQVFPMPGSAEAGYNLTIEYWKKYPDLADDSDETLFLWPENCLYYMYWQESIRRRLPIEEQTARKIAWQVDLEDRVADDGLFRDIPMYPTQGEYYSNFY